MKLIDLSQTIENKMQAHPYDGGVSVYQNKLLEVDGYNNYKVNISLHVGTHIDAPMHMSENKNFICDYPLENFCGNALVFDVRGQDVINLLPDMTDKIHEGDIVLFCTGFESEFGTEKYYLEYPTLDSSLIDTLISKKVKVIGLDTPSPDNFPFDDHIKLFEQGIFIIENLKNLSDLLGAKKIELFAFPIKIKADSSLIRAVARIE